METRLQQVECEGTGSVFVKLWMHRWTFNSADESWIICFAPLSPSLFSFLFTHHLCLARSLSPSHYSLVIPHTLALCLPPSSHLLWVSISLFHSAPLCFQSLPHALNSSVFSIWSPVINSKCTLGTICHSWWQNGSDGFFNKDLKSVSALCTAVKSCKKFRIGLGLTKSWLRNWILQDKNLHFKIQMNTYGSLWEQEPD